MRVLDLPGQMLGLLRRALCPREARVLVSELADRRRSAGLGVNPMWADRLPRQEIRLQLSRVCSAVRLADREAAIAALAQCEDSVDGDAARFNLLGVIAEMRRQWRAARWLYGQALFVNHKYRPAERNLRRLYELHTFGRTNESVSLGDEIEEDVWFARMPDLQTENCR